MRRLENRLCPPRAVPQPACSAASAMFKCIPSREQLEQEAGLQLTAAALQPDQRLVARAVRVLGSQEAWARLVEACGQVYDRDWNRPWWCRRLAEEVSAQKACRARYAAVMLGAHALLLHRSRYIVLTLHMPGGLCHKPIPCVPPYSRKRMNPHVPRAVCHVCSPVRRLAQLALGAPTVTRSGRRRARREASSCRWWRRYGGS